MEISSIINLTVSKYVVNYPSLERILTERKLLRHYKLQVWLFVKYLNVMRRKYVGTYEGSMLYIQNVAEIL